MFIKCEDPMELRETVTTLQNRFKFQNLSGQVAVAVWEMNCSSVDKCRLLYLDNPKEDGEQLAWSSYLEKDLGLLWITAHTWKNNVMWL